MPSTARAQAAPPTASIQSTLSNRRKAGSSWRRSEMPPRISRPVAAAGMVRRAQTGRLSQP